MTAPPPEPLIMRELAAKRQKKHQRSEQAWDHSAASCAFLWLFSDLIRTDHANCSRRQQLRREGFDAEEMNGGLVVPTVTNGEVAARCRQKISSASREESRAIDDRRVMDFLDHDAELFRSRVNASLAGPAKIRIVVFG